MSGVCVIRERQHACAPGRVSVAMRSEGYIADLRWPVLCVVISGGKLALCWTDCHVHRACLCSCGAFPDELSVPIRVSLE